MSNHADTDELPGSEYGSDHARREGNRRRAARARAKRQGAGQTRISAWVPQERAAYARRVLQAVVAGGNTLPPDPEQAAALDALRAELDQTRTAAARREEELAAERDAARHELQAAEAATAQAEAAAGRFQEAPGLRGWVIRWLAR